LWEYKDPILKEPEPITLFLPVAENFLKSIGIKVSREEIVKRFYKESPRIVIVTGAMDHPAQIYDYETAKIVASEIWELGAIPFLTTLPAICDGIAQGHYGMRFSLKSRNLSTQFLANHIIGHHYNGAIILTSCDKRPVADVAAAVRVDKLYKEKFGKHFYAMFINSPVMKDIRLPDNLKNEYLDITRKKNDSLLTERLRCNVYTKYFKNFTELFRAKKVSQNRAVKFLNNLALYSCPTGGTCPFLGTGNTSKFALFTLGVVPERFAFMPAEKHLDRLKNSSKIFKNFLSIVQNQQTEFAISNIVRNNFANSIKTVAAINGSLNWFLHFEYLSETLNLKYTRERIIKLTNKIPVLFNYNKSIYDFASDINHQRTFFHTLFKKNIIKNSITISGYWKELLKENKRTKNDVFMLKKSLPPVFVSFKSNLFDSVLIKLTPTEKEGLKKFHNKYFISKIFWDEDEFNNIALNSDNIYKDILNSFKKKDIKKIEKLNNGDINIAIFILKEGYKADGMPEMYYPTEYINNDDSLKDKVVLLTDGRFSGASYGFSFGYMKPECVESKKLISLQDGMILYFDLNKKFFKYIK